MTASRESGEPDQQTSGLKGVEATWEDTDCEIVAGKSKRGKKSRQHKQSSMHFFSLQLIFPPPGVSGWR